MALHLSRRLLTYGTSQREPPLSTLPSQVCIFKHQKPAWRHFFGEKLPRYSGRQQHSQVDSKLQVAKAVGTIEKQNAVGRPDSVVSASPVVSPGIISGGVVALGKFDALHIGHRSLVEKASTMGPPWLLSFVGMAEVLGWQARLPVVAPCDRGRVMNLWASDCGGAIPSEYAMDFAKVRSLSPSEFVRILAQDLGVRGVVAGENYRFGYKAAGSAEDLVRLCADFGLASAIVSAVSLQPSRSLNGSTASAQGQVSSTRVRESLAAGSLHDVKELLGRPYRLIANMQAGGGRQGLWERSPHVMLPASCLLNQPPRDGTYRCTALLHRERVVGIPERRESQEKEASGGPDVRDSGLGRVGVVGANWGEEREECVWGNAQVEIHASGIEVTFERECTSEMIADWTCLALEFRS